MFAFGSRVCRWGQSCPPINREIVAGGYEPLCFVKFTCIRQFFAVRFKSVCFNIWWENRNLRKVAPHPQPKHKDNQLVSICFHARRLKKILLNLRSFAGSKGRGAELTIFTGSLLFVEFRGGAEVLDLPSSCCLRFGFISPDDGGGAPERHRHTGYCNAKVELRYAYLVSIGILWSWDLMSVQAFIAHQQVKTFLFMRGRLGCWTLATACITEPIETMLHCIRFLHCVRLGANAQGSIPRKGWQDGFDTKS